MDGANVDKQVLSPIPSTYAYAAPASEALPFYQTFNDGVAEMVRGKPDRFIGLGTLPMQDPDAACAELERICRELPLSGIEIGTHAAGRDLDDPAFDPLWAICAERDALVFIHPDTAPGFERMSSFRLANSIGYPSETGVTAAKMIMSGVFQRHSNLRIILAHGGGTLGWLLPRLDHVWTHHEDLRSAVAGAPSTAARNFYCDTLTYDGASLHMLIERFGNDRLMAGSDYPFPMMEASFGKVIDDGGFDDATRAAMFGTTAETLFLRSRRPSQVK